MWRRIVVMGVALAGVTMGYLSSTAWGSGSDGSAASGPSYVIEDATFQAGTVRFTAAWPGAGYPGQARCIAQVRDASGDVIGQRSFSILDTAESAVHSIPVGTQAGASAEVSCDPATRPSGSAGYVITKPHLEGPEDKLMLAYDVAWTTEEPPMVQLCQADMMMPDGATKTVTWELSTGPGPSEMSLPGSFMGSQPHEITCSPL